MSKIVIVGDLFPVKSNLVQFSRGDVKGLFDKKILQLFSDADCRICNLEGAITAGNERCEKTGPVICAPTSIVNTYKSLGIDYCMLANNHITDAGHQGVIDTMRALDEVGIKYIGAGVNENSIPHYEKISLNTKTVYIYNVSERMYNQPTANKAGVWLYDEYVVCKELESLKTQCDYLIVIYHGGIEKFRYPSPEIKKRFHRMADSGADMILSQHTHCIGCEEFYNGSYLLYGQGDFLLNNFRPEFTDIGIVLELDVDEKGIEIQKHLVKCSPDLSLKYIDNPDFTAFDERSEKVNDDSFLLEQFQQFCQKELRLYLNAFKSPGRMPRLLRRYFPNRYLRWLYTKAYSRRDLLFTLHTLRSEQNRETAITGIEFLLNDMAI